MSKSRLICAILATILFFSAIAAAAQPDPPKKFSHGVLIHFKGIITPSLETFLNRKLETAEAAGADLVIIEIDSPGGMLGPSLDIATRLQEIDWAHTVAYVPREALSGAAIAALGCDEIITAPTARLGDAGPVVLGEDALFRHAPEKVVSDLAQRMRNLALAKGRPPALAEAMVDMNLTVYRVENTKTGKIACMSDREIKGLADPGEWKKGAEVAESGGGRFLEVNGDRAVELGLAQANAGSRMQVANRYGLDDLTVLQQTAVDTTVDILNNSWVTGLLLVVGLLGLYIEFTSPGTGLGGLLAGLCFAIFFWSHFLGGTAGWLEVVLFLLGVTFVAVELFLLPGVMVAGITGAVLILASLVMASQSFLIPHSARELATLSNTLLMVFLSGVAFTAVAITLGRRFGSLPVLSRLTLAPPDTAGTAGAGASGVPPPAADDGFAPPPVQVGDVGIAQSLLRPGGKARFGNQYIDVVTEGDFITKGDRIRVSRVSGNLVVVEAEDRPANA